MARRRYLVALTEGELTALRGACSAAEAAGTGGDFSRHDQRMIAQARRQLDTAEAHEVIVGMSTAEATAVWSLAQCAGNTYDDALAVVDSAGAVHAANRGMERLWRAVPS